MWIILVSVVTTTIMLITYTSEKWSNPASGVNIAQTSATSVAGNVIAYATVVKQFALANKVYDSPVTLSQFNGFNTYQIRLLGDYRAAVIQYGQSKYELVSWDTISNAKTKPELVMNALADLTNTHRSIAGNTNVVPLLVINNACTATIVNSYVGNVYKGLTGNQQLFKDICLNHLPSGYKMGKYNMLTQLVD